jgi:ABC-2 type transport system ATP-binding protein
MGYKIDVSKLNYQIGRDKRILTDINFNVEPGSFVAVLGENGAGKTTLLDLMMGFREPSAGSLLVQDEQPYLDNWEQRNEISYLSEKVDMPGDWSAGEFLDFNKFFYKNYSGEKEQNLVREFRVDRASRLGNMSAGEIRRAQVVASLSIQPSLIIVDEITAVLDIVGRRKFMNLLNDLNKTTGCTVVLATNILEDLAEHISHVLLVQKGTLRSYQPLSLFLEKTGKSGFSQKVADLLEEQP